MGDYDYPRESQVTGQLPFLEFNFADADNPYFAWEAYSLCREFGATVPDWALNYLDRAARALLSGEDELRALGFKSERGRSSKLREYRRVDRDWKLAFAVKQVLHEDETKYGKAKLTAACKKVAEHHNVGWRTVERSYKEVMG